MFNYLEKLGQKPDGAKKRIAFLVSFLCVGIIFVVWITAIYPQFGQEKSISDRISASETSPFSTFTAILSQSTSAIGEQISKIKQLGSSLYGGADYYNLATTTPEATASTTQ